MMTARFEGRDLRTVCQYQIFLLLASKHPKMQLAGAIIAGYSGGSSALVAPNWRLHRLEAPRSIICRPRR